MAGAGEATFKSNVLVREEKGFAGIPFKRIMLAFMGGALAYMFSRFVVGGWSALVGVATAVLTVILTAPRGGIPLWQRLLYRVRGRLIVAQIDRPESWPARLGKFMELRADALVFSGEALFKMPEDDRAALVDWSEWLAYTELGQAMNGEGIQIVEGPRALQLAAPGKPGVV